MKLLIDLDNGILHEGDTQHAIGSPQAFSLISRAWLRSGWDAKYVYGFTWLGRPIIQLPEDMLRIQEIIYRVRPSVILETGVAHGGSLVFYASLLKLMGRGRVIGVDVEIRPHNRQAIESHELAPLITLVEADSIAPATVEQVRALIGPQDTVLVMLDSNHTRDHVLAELRGYAPLVTPGSYAVAADGIMASLRGAPRTQPDWEWNNPMEAARLFAEEDKRFAIEDPGFVFNEGTVREQVSYWPNAYLRRMSS